jgi:hypothetical protein
MPESHSWVIEDPEKLDKLFKGIAQLEDIKGKSELSLFYPTDYIIPSNFYVPTGELILILPNASLITSNLTFDENLFHPCLIPKAQFSSKITSKLKFPSSSSGNFTGKVITKYASFEFSGRLDKLEGKGNYNLPVTIPP